MATIIGNYKLTINIDGEEEILKDKIRLGILKQYHSNDFYEMQLCIKGSPDLGNFLKNYDTDARYLDSYWNIIQYIPIKANYWKNNKILEIMHKINEKEERKEKYEDRVTFNFCSSSNRKLTTNSFNDIGKLTDWVKRAKSRKMPLLRFNEKTSECIRCGFAKLELDIDNKKVFAIII